MIHALYFLKLIIERLVMSKFFANKDNKNPWVMFLCTSLFLCTVIFIILHFYYMGSVTPRLRVFGRESQHFSQEVLYQNLHGFDVFDDGVIISYHNDPWILVVTDPNIVGNTLMIDVSELSVRSTSAQIFFAREGEHFNEMNSRRFVIRRGLNIISLPYSNYVALRLDLVEMTGISIVVNEVIFANYTVFSIQFWIALILITLAVIGILYLFMYKNYILVSIFNAYERNKGIILYLLFCFFVYSLWAIITPFNGAPDEHMRWDLVRFMVDNGSLPRGDDPQVPDVLWGFSYAYNPFTTQIIGAALYRVSLFLFSPSSHVLLYMTRLPSILSSVGTVFFTFSIGKTLFEKKYAWFLTVLISMWPQFTMVSSYINNDAFAIFTISIILYSWVLGIKNNWNMKSCVLLAIGVGLCFLSYYNAFVFILFSAPLWLWSVFKRKDNRADYNIFVKKIGIMLLIVFVIAGWFYIRNAYLYNGDFLGLRTQSMQGEIYAVDWLRPSNRDNLMNRGYSITYLLTDMPWLRISYRSFIAQFGYMNIVPHRMVHIVFNLLIVSGLSGLLFSISKAADYMPIYLFSLSSIPIVVGLSLYFSFSSGEALIGQPQGRYLLPVLLPLCILITLGLSGWRKFIPARLDSLVGVLNPLILGLIILMNCFSLFSVFAFYHL